jgi:predicted ATPase
MEKLLVKNFGPIRSINLKIKDVNIFIGSISGKSTAAKLIAILKQYL